MAYAERSDVTSDRSRAEIERTLIRYGADEFQYGWATGEARLGFAIAGRRVLFRLPLPNRNDRRFTHTPGRGLERDTDARDREYEQAVRQRWRALSLVIKAKLEAVDAGITTVEQEFLSHILLPNGSSVGDWVAPQLAIAYERNEMPSLMPGGVR